MNLFLTDRNPLIVWQLTLLQGFTNSTNFVEVTSSSANMYRGYRVQFQFEFGFGQRRSWKAFGNEVFLTLCHFAWGIAWLYRQPWISSQPFSQSKVWHTTIQTINFCRSHRWTAFCWRWCPGWQGLHKNEENDFALEEDSWRSATYFEIQSQTEFSKVDSIQCPK